MVGLVNRESTGGNPTETAATVQTGRRSGEERQDILARIVQGVVAQGARVESQTGHSAVLVRGRRVSHTLHFLISLFTIGVWLIVWVILSLSGGEKRKMVTVDEYGNAATQELGKGGLNPMMIVAGVILLIGFTVVFRPKP